METRHFSARLLASLVLAPGLVLVAACGGGESEAAGSGEAAADASDDQNGQTGSPTTTTAAEMTIAGVTFAPPASWEDLGPEGMRQAQFRLAPIAGDEEAAEVNVFYFGPASGGGVEANLQRWIGQIEDGTEPVRDRFTAGGMTGHTVALDGSYKAGGMRPMGDDGGEAKPGYRLVGVVLEGPRGSVFFKLTGPEATARAMEEGLMAMVQDARSDG